MNRSGRAGKTKGPSTYAEAGVDLSKVGATHAALARILSSTFVYREGRVGEVLTGIGHYAGLIEIGHGRVLALHVDGVGSKVLVAQALNRYDTVGIDCVAMCVNDLVCVGAEPVTMIDYLALQKPNPLMVDEIMKGLSRGAKEAGIAIVGGETAILPDVIKGVRGRGFDLVGMAVGILDRKKIIDGRKVMEGDVILGVASSGIHSNGLTLARKVLFSKYGIDDQPEELDRPLGEELLTPTWIYVKAVLELLEKTEVHGLANVTGGAFSKLTRVRPSLEIGFRLDKMPEPPPIFRLIQRVGRVSKKEMYRVFNMGVGFCVILPENEADTALSLLEKNAHHAVRIGSVDGSGRITVSGMRLD